MTSKEAAKKRINRMRLWRMKKRIKELNNVRLTDKLFIQLIGCPILHEPLE